MGCTAKIQIVSAPTLEINQGPLMGAVIFRLREHLPERQRVVRTLKIINPWDRSQGWAQRLLHSKQRAFQCYRIPDFAEMTLPMSDSMVCGPIRRCSKTPLLSITRVSGRTATGLSDQSDLGSVCSDGNSIPSFSI